MSRKKAREKIFQLVFEYNFTEEYNQRTLDILTADLETSKEDKDFIVLEYEGIINHYDDIILIISRYTPAYRDISRLAATDLAAMVLATYEMKYTEIPKPVAINEAVDIAKIYGGEEKSRNFVNGVLASILKEING